MRGILIVFLLTLPLFAQNGTASDVLRGEDVDLPPLEFGTARPPTLTASTTTRTSILPFGSENEFRDPNVVEELNQVAGKAAQQTIERHKPEPEWRSWALGIGVVLLSIVVLTAALFSVSRRR